MRTYTRRIALIISLVILALPISGCLHAYTTTVVMDDGTEIETLPRCVWGSKLVADDVEGGIEVDRISRMRSHAGVEPAIVGATAVAVGGALLVSALVADDADYYQLKLASGGVVASLGLLPLVSGIILNRISVGALDRTCSPRRSDLPDM
jgi:hypothetical protein